MAELRGDTQNYLNNGTDRRTTNSAGYDNGFGPTRTPTGYDNYGRAPPTSRYNTQSPATQKERQQKQEHQQYEMASARQPQKQPDLSTMPAFFEEIDYLKIDIATVGNNIQEIQSLHESALASTNGSQSRNYASQLATLKEETQKRNDDIKNRIKVMEGVNGNFPANTSDGQIRHTQISALRKRFLSTIQEYQDMERMYDQRYRQRMERQIRIVKPEATPEQIEEIIDSDQSSQVFTQSVSDTPMKGGV
ncbi:unnamed protein product [Absidia cylindrospora]